MNKLNKLTFITAGLACMLWLISCETQDEGVTSKQSVKFSFTVSDLSNQGGRVTTAGTLNVASVVVSIRDGSHESVYASEKLALFEFNGKYISEPISMIPGTYYLYEFFVVDSNGKVVLASPVEYSAKAYLVKDPLDIKMSVAKDHVAEITPEVLSTEGFTPENFGYATFSFNEVKTFNFLVSVFAYDSLKNKLDLAWSNITIRSDDNTLKFSKVMDPVTTMITLPEKYSRYSILIEKPGYQPYFESFTTAQLKTYLRSEDNGPLMITLHAGKMILWNKLGSDQEVLNSAVGPNLAFFSGGDGLHVPANHEYVNGKFGKAITIAPGTYYSTNRVHNVVLNDLPHVLNAERGTIECYFFQNKSPIAYDHNPHRIFDGPYGFLSGMGFVSQDYYENGVTNAMTFYLGLGGTPVSVSIMDFDKYNGKWIHAAAVWDRDGIGPSHETMRLYINGNKVASTTENNWGTQFGQQADIAGGNDQNIARQFYVDELKIYNFAKTNF